MNSIEWMIVGVVIWMISSALLGSWLGAKIRESNDEHENQDP